MTPVRAYVAGFASAVLVLGALAWAQQRSFDDTVVAVVNGENITRRHLVERLLQYHGEAALTALVNQALTRQAAQKHQVTVTPQEVDTKLNEVKTLLRGEFEKFLVTSGLTEAQYREQVYYTLLAEKTALKIDPIKDSDLEQIQVRVILCRDMEHARALLRQLNQGADFAVLARQESLDQPSAAQGGLRPPFFRVDFPDLWEFASKLNVGQYTREPAPVNMGRAMLIKLERRIPAAQVRVTDRDRAVARIKSYKIDRLLDLLRREGKIEYPVKISDIIRAPATP